MHVGNDHMVNVFRLQTSQLQLVDDVVFLRAVINIRLRDAGRRVFLGVHPGPQVKQDISRGGMAKQHAIGRTLIPCLLYTSRCV